MSHQLLLIINVATEVWMAQRSAGLVWTAPHRLNRCQLSHSSHIVITFLTCKHGAGSWRMSSIEREPTGWSIKGRQAIVSSTHIQVSTQLRQVSLSRRTSTSNLSLSRVLVCFCSLQVVKMKAMQVIPLTLLFVLTASAQVLKFGKCPKPAVQANFDATRVNKDFPSIALTKTIV